GQAVGLLPAQVPDVRDVHGLVGEEADDGQRLGLVGHVVEVEVAAAQAPRARDRDRVGRPGDLAAHLLQDAREAGVALPGPGAEVAHGDRAARDGGGGPEVAGGHRVALDAVVVGEVLPRRDREAAVAVALDHGPDVGHDVERHVDARLREELTLDLDAHRPPRQWRRHQQAGEELRADVAAHAHAPAWQPGGADRHGRPAVDGPGLHAEAGQGLDEVADRPLAHAGVAVEDVLALAG